MTENWEGYPCLLGERLAHIAFDYDVHARIRDLPLPYFAGFRVEFLDADDRGMPGSDAELARLEAVEQFLTRSIAGDDGRLVGRITSGGARVYLFYTRLDQDTCHELGHRITQDPRGSGVMLVHKEDPKRRHYWDDLYPSDDDWQVIKDLRTERALVERGDTLQQAREIEHLAHFDTEARRAAFLDKVRPAFDVIDLAVLPSDAGPRYAARLRHTSRPDYRSMNATTLLLARSAAANGGHYAGWETTLCTG
ncbi:MAG: DUF695 domain-containing protein [Burkholderiales bacterium]|nr:DUF695 domain-containing protein [Burkholderiales bacterium]